MPEIDPAGYLQTDPGTGLSTQEAVQRQKKFGSNRIESKEATWFERLLHRFWGPIPWMIEAAAILSAMVQRWEDFIIKIRIGDRKTGAMAI